MRRGGTGVREACREEERGGGADCCSAYGAAGLRHAAKGK